MSGGSAVGFPRVETIGIVAISPWPTLAYGRSSMSEFKVKDVVQAISGGPLMTVVEVGNYEPLGPANGVRCQWFDTVKGIRKVSIEVLYADGLEMHDPGSMSMTTIE